MFLVLVEGEVPIVTVKPIKDGVEALITVEDERAQRIEDGVEDTIRAFTWSGIGKLHIDTNPHAFSIEGDAGADVVNLKGV